MGMGYAGWTVEVVGDETIDKYAQKEYKAFLDVLTRVDATIDEFAQCVSNETEFENDTDDCTVSAILVNEYKALCKAFHDATGAIINIGYLDSEQQGRYDEITGHIWHIEGIWTLTDAGILLGNKVRKYGVTSFG